MGTIIRRVLIIVALTVLVYLLVTKYGRDEIDPGKTPEELKTFLAEVVEKEWNALVAGDWVTVYELTPPKVKEQKTLVQFLQGREQIYYENFKLLGVTVEGLTGSAEVQYDWGVNLDMKVDIGNLKKEDVVLRIHYKYDLEQQMWYKVDKKEDNGGG